MIQYVDDGEEEAKDDVVVVDIGVDADADADDDDVIVLRKGKQIPDPSRH